MDCNSLLYDCFRNIDIEKQQDIETELIRCTIERIEYYINKIEPKELIFIAFDGVAPFAKMDQQRTRRYRSCYETFVIADDLDLKTGFSTSLFTPGTTFMKQLSLAMQFHFNAPAKYGVRRIIVATPEEAGEGEHKLYAHLRENPMIGTQVAAFYGLDADLIMLSLLHLQYAPQLYVFREVPAFAHVLLNSNPQENDLEPCFLDIRKLGNSISSTMGCRVPHINRMLDYVFLCFFLGNDFLPHFPSLNIRTNGIQRLLDVYNETIGNKQETFLLTQTTPPKINWNQLHTFIKALSTHEHTFILQEYALRKKWDSRGPRSYKIQTREERLILLQDSPILFRQEEMYICPKENFWEERYYQRLFKEKDEISHICINYLEGLEWVLTYYLEGCIDWKWKYNYNYPPLLKDLVQVVPKIPTTFFYRNNTKPFKSSTQLIYVLPPNLHESVLSDTALNMIRTKYSQYFLPCKTRDDLETWKFQWAFCRYFWECHIETPEIPLEILEEWD